MIVSKPSTLGFWDFSKGVPDQEMERWYASVMLNRLMFIYFIQKKGFPERRRTDYLRTKLGESQANGTDRYYTDFLCPLFFEGFAKPESERDVEAKAAARKSALSEWWHLSATPNRGTSWGKDSNC